MNNNIYHYTSLVGLKSILATQTLWMTKHHYLNDSKEFKDGLHRIQNAVSEYLINNKDLISPYNYEGIELTMKWLQNTSIYVTSFCKHGDLLSLWERYGQYAIEFDFDNSKMMNRKEGTFSNLISCIYDSEEKDRMTKVIVEGYLKNFEIYPKFDKSDLYDLFIGYLDCILRAKNEYFFEEQEVRYVMKAHINNEDIIVLKDGECSDSFGRPIISVGPLYALKKQKILTRKAQDKEYDIIYVEKQFPKQFIKSITVSPSLDFELTKKELETFLSKNDYTIEIKQSKIPLK